MWGGGTGRQACSTTLKASRRLNLQNKLYNAAAPVCARAHRRAAGMGARHRSISALLAMCPRCEPDLITRSYTCADDGDDDFHEAANAGHTRGRQRFFAAGARQGARDAGGGARRGLCRCCLRGPPGALAACGVEAPARAAPWAGAQPQRGRLPAAHRRPRPREPCGRSCASGARWHWPWGAARRPGRSSSPRGARARGRRPPKPAVRSGAHEAPRAPRPSPSACARGR